MAHTFNRDRFTLLAYLFLAFYGYFINVLGPITPFLKDELKLSYTVAGLHYTAFAVGILLVGLGGHLVIRRLGSWRSLWAGALGISLSTVLLLIGKTPLITIGACFLMGSVGSLILAIVPSALSEQYGELRAVALSEANVIASAVAAGAPLLVGWSARWAGSWRLALASVALAPILMYIIFRKDPSPMQASGGGFPAQAGRSLPLLYWVYWVAIVLGVAVEFCIISWSANYLETVLGMLRADAAQSVSLFLVAMMLGRLLGGHLVRIFSIHKLLIASILVAIAGYLLFWLTDSISLALGGLFVAGLGVASLYPLIISLAIGAVPDDTVQASARATLASGTAILTLPLILGRLADSVGIRLAFGIVALLLVCVFAIIRFTARAVPAHPLVVG
jgi:fucose permease